MKTYLTYRPDPPPLPDDICPDCDYERNHCRCDTKPSGLNEHKQDKSSYCNSDFPVGHRFHTMATYQE